MDGFSFSFDIARVSAPIGESGYVNGWLATGIGMFVVIFCLVIIAFIIAFLPRILIVLNRYFPDNSGEEIKKPTSDNSSPVEAVAAVVAVAFHNTHNSGK
ncbi:MAG: OadG family protein [Chitinispirillales bacterium]|jgi:Na+-transporting methylmalonyl-CoA/oxaloacetate decarboxylase gamma subunit|nr:OadG family protein [Chitinispirillales bacterium]